MSASSVPGSSSTSPAFESLRRDAQTNKLFFVPPGSSPSPTHKRDSRAVSESTEGPRRRVAPRPHGQNVMQLNYRYLLSRARRGNPPSTGGQVLSTAVLSPQRRVHSRKSGPCTGMCQTRPSASVSSEAHAQADQTISLAESHGPEQVSVARDEAESSDSRRASCEDPVAVEAQVKQSIQIFVTPPDDADHDQDQAEAAAKEAVHDATLRALEGHRVEETDSLYTQSDDTLVNESSQDDEGHTTPAPSLADVPSVYSQQTQSSEELKFQQPGAAVSRSVSPPRSAVQSPARRGFRYVSSIEEPVLQKLPYDRYIAVASQQWKDDEVPSTMLCGRIRLCNKIEARIARPTLDGVPEHWKMFAGS